MRPVESLEFTNMRRDREDAEGFLSNPDPWKRRYVETAHIKEIDPQERD